MDDYSGLIDAEIIGEFESEVLNRIVPAFEKDVAKSLILLRLTAEAGDRAAFRSIAHSLAGCAGVVGARSLERVARAAMEERSPGSERSICTLLQAEARRAVVALSALAGPIAGIG